MLLALFAGRGTLTRNPIGGDSSDEDRQKNCAQPQTPENVVAETHTRGIGAAMLKIQT